MVLLSRVALLHRSRPNWLATMRDLHPGAAGLVRRSGAGDRKHRAGRSIPVFCRAQADPVLRHHFPPPGVVTTVDARQWVRQLDRYIESVARSRSPMRSS